MRRLVAALALGACLTPFAAPAGAGDARLPHVRRQRGSGVRQARRAHAASTAWSQTARSGVYLRRSHHRQRRCAPDRPPRGGTGRSIARSGPPSGAAASPRRRCTRDELALIGTFTSIDGHARTPRRGRRRAHGPPARLEAAAAQLGEPLRPRVRSRSRAGRSWSAATARLFAWRTGCGADRLGAGLPNSR